MRARLRPLRALACGAGCTVAVAAAAFANTTTIGDPNDTAGPIDIKSANAGHARNGWLKHVVRFYGNVPAKGEVGNELLEIWKSKPHVMAGCGGCFKESSYRMQGPQTGKRDVFMGGEAGTKYRKTGTGRIVRKGRTLTFLFPRKAIGNPKHAYFWRIRTDYYGPASECPAGPCEDHAPNGSRVVKHKL